MELARVCIDLESWGVPHIHGIVQQLSALVAHQHHLEIPVLAPTVPKLVGLVSFTLVQIPQFAATDIQKRLGTASRKLLTHYVKCQVQYLYVPPFRCGVDFVLYCNRQGEKLSQMVRQAILTPNWLKAKLPRDIRSVRPLPCLYCRTGPSHSM